MNEANTLEKHYYASFLNESEKHLENQKEWDSTDLKGVEAKVRSDEIEVLQPIHSDDELDSNLIAEEQADSHTDFLDDDFLQESNSENLSSIIEGCNDALKELKEAREKLESQLKDSKMSYKRLSISQPEQSDAEQKESSSISSTPEVDEDEADYSSQIKETDSMKDFEQKMLQEGTALQALTANLETFQSELDGMLQELMQDEKAAFSAVENFLEASGPSKILKDDEERIENSNEEKNPEVDNTLDEFIEEYSKVEKDIDTSSDANYKCSTGVENSLSH